MATPKKGDTIFVVNLYGTGEDPRFPESYGKPSISVRELRVESMGKVQGTATDVHAASAGRYLKCHIHPWTHYATTREACGPLVDREIAALRARFAGSLDLDRRWLADHPGARPEVKARKLEAIRNLEAMIAGEVRVDDYATLEAETTATVRAAFAAGRF
jgi:hypothetical protein